MSVTPKPPIRKFYWSAVINGIVPVAVYWSLRPHVASDTVALGCAAGIPICWGVVQMIGRRQLEPLNIVAIVGFLVVLIVSIAAGDNPLPLKLYGAVVAAALGIGCWISIVIRKPLVLAILRMLSQYEPTFATWFERVSQEPGSIRHLNVVTAIVGTTLLVDAVAHGAVAILLPTGSYLIVVRIVNWIIRGVGAIALIWYVKQWRAERAESRSVE